MGVRMTVPQPPFQPPSQPYGQPPAAAMYVPRFFIRQRITMMINRYEIRAANPDGSEGQLLALAEQRRMKLKEEVNFFADESKTRRVFSFQARHGPALPAGADALAQDGR